MKRPKSLLQELMDLQRQNPEAVKRRMEKLTSIELLDLARENTQYSREFELKDEGSTEGSPRSLATAHRD
ncbi:MAG TPA: hypothetical protein VK615_08595 [Candidatus Binatia bacterium]|nr:hypothetical protein [Candidatus Binatia bacterium]